MQPQMLNACCLQVGLKLPQSGAIFDSGIRSGVTEWMGLCLLDNSNQCPQRLIRVVADRKTRQSHQAPAPRLRCLLNTVKQIYFAEPC
jgi:hypothetical protein